MTRAHSIDVKQVACGFLLVAWLYPLWASLFSGPTAALSLFCLPSGTALIDSNRSWLFLICAAAAALSGFGPLRARGLAIPGGLFLAWTILSSLLGSAPTDSLLFCFSWFAAAAAYSATRSLAAPRWSWKQRIGLLHAPVALVALLALLPLMVDSSAEQVTGPFQLANIYSNWLLLLLPMLMGDLYLQGSESRWPWALLSSTLALTSLILTHSRASWVLASLAISGTMLLSLNCRGRKLAAYLSLAGIGCLAVVFFRHSLGGGIFLPALMGIIILPGLLEPLLQKRPQLARNLLLLLLATSLSVFAVSSSAANSELAGSGSQRLERFATVDNSTKSRLELWSAALDMTLAHPVWGTGPTTYATHYPEFQQHYYYYSDSPHCTSLELSSELGLGGFLLFVSCLLIWLKMSFKQNTAPDKLRQLALMGTLLGLAQAQVDVTYQFAELWTTLAIVAALTQGPREPESSHSPGRFRASVLILALLTPLLLYITWAQRLYERSLLLNDQLESFRLSQQASNKLPGWSKPAQKALQLGLKLTASQEVRLPLRELEPLLERVAKSAQHKAKAELLQGRYYRQAEQPQKAVAPLERALRLDPFNFPQIYHELFQLKLKSGEREAALKLGDRALELYKLEQLERAHHAHRAVLTAQLVPLLYDIADTLNPYYNPERTEPLYRFILKERGEVARALHGLGVSLLVQGRRREAIPLLEKAHKLNPGFPAP